MALALDAHVLRDPVVAAHLELALDFVGSIPADATNVQACATSSGWSECVVNAYHLCGQGSPGWWNYSVCLYAHQYPPSSSARNSRAYLECAGMNPQPGGRSCTKADFPGIVANISAACAERAGLDADAVEMCATGSAGVDRLKGSIARSYGFPLSPMLKVEPQWILVDGPDNCSKAEGGWAACKDDFDKTSCLDWGHCDADAWALHLRRRICEKAGIIC